MTLVDVPRPLLAAAMLVSTILAGCAGAPSGDNESPGSLPDNTPNIVDGYLVSATEAAGDVWRATTAAGTISTVIAPADGTLSWPSTVYRFDPDAAWFTSNKSEAVSAGDEINLLLPPRMQRLVLTFEGEEVVIPVAVTERGLFDGANIIEWFKVQRERFPNRCNGCESFVASQPYFADLMTSFGIEEVEIDPYSQNPTHGEFANVVGYRYAKVGVEHPVWLGVGGHYDLVTGTKEGAFDNTAGSLATLELSRVFGSFQPNNNMVFGLWGGEEAGLQGSQFFVRTNPDIAAQMETYINLDVNGFSWPGPPPTSSDGSTPACDAPQPRNDPDQTDFCPDPVVISTGPDGPEAQRLLSEARVIQQSVVDYPDAYFYYEPVASGQVAGYAGVNAQSDHTSFIAAGVPSYFLFNGNALRNPIGIHNQHDTIENWTKYMAWNMNMDFEVNLTADERADAEALMADSFETYLWIVFYLFLQYDLDEIGQAQESTGFA